MKFIKQHWSKILLILILLAGAIMFVPKTELAAPFLAIGFLVGAFFSENAKYHPEL